jgi:hypothetical protein
MKYRHLLLLTILWSGAQTAAAQSGSILGILALTAADKLIRMVHARLILETTCTGSSSSQPDRINDAFVVSAHSIF